MMKCNFKINILDKKFIFFILLLFFQFSCLANNKKNLLVIKHPSYLKIKYKSIFIWNKIIKNASIKYKIDKKLIESIIYVESGGNYKAKSHSNAVGLMQIKASSAGKEVYQIIGKKGKPSKSELLDPKKNIDIGTKYIQILQKKNLYGIKNSRNLRCATIVAYCNGSNILLKIFSKNKKKAIFKINHMNSKQLIAYITKKHPCKQAIKYLNKVLKIYSLL